jgi:serine/threonine-protein kinase
MGGATFIAGIAGERDQAKRPPAQGDIVDGKYLLLQPLGEGGMGLIFEAEHLRLRQIVAIKFLRPDVLALPEAIARFEREARASVCMRGRHVVHVLDVDTDAEGRPYIVMERLHGRDLEAELRTRGRLPIREAVDLVLQACAAVAEAHDAGIVHRDLKPSNLFLADLPGSRRIVKVLDFGISKMTREAEPAVTSTTTTIGTPLYMSPEQVRSSRDVDSRTDIWALGVILYELVAGAPPFRGTTTAAIAAIVADATPSLVCARQETPPGLERVVATALAKSPEDRFPDVQAFAAALSVYASHGASAGPFSLRPTPHALRVAKAAMARAPRGPSVSNATELLRLHSWQGRSPPSRLYGDALKTFVGTLALGMGLATAATTIAGSGDNRDHRLPREAIHAQRAADPANATPGSDLARGAPLHPPVSTASVASRPRSRSGPVGAPTSREPPRTSASGDVSRAPPPGVDRPCADCL